VSHRGPWTGSSQLDGHIRSQLVGEITDPHLQDAVMSLCADLIKSDGHLADDEVHMLDELAGAWPRRYAPSAAQSMVPASAGVY